jgi:hypothetical protein
MERIHATQGALRNTGTADGPRRRYAEWRLMSRQRWQRVRSEMWRPWLLSVPRTQRLETVRVIAVLFALLSVACVAAQAWPGLIITVPATTFGLVRWFQLTRQP